MKRQQVACFVLLTLLLIVANNESVFGQGKLARVRDAVRHSKASSEPKKQPKKKKQKRNHRPAKKNRRRASKQNSRPSLVIAPSIRLASLVQEVHVVHQAPHQVVAEPVFVEPIQTPQPVYQPVVNPIAVEVSPEEVHPESVYVSQNVCSFDWGVRLSAIGGTDFDDIAFGRLDLLLQIPNGPGIDTSVTMLRESGMSYRDHLYLGDVNFVYEPIALENFRMRFGIGVNWLSDSFGGDAGFNMTSGFDWRLTERSLVTGEIDFGTIGDTDITHAQLGLGRTLVKTTELTVGYDYVDIGGVTIGSAFTGLRFRF